MQYDSLPSTNELARQMAAQGATEGTIIVAREQTSGRGRLGRSWASAAGEGLYVSIILRPKVPPRQFSIMTLASAVAVAETLASAFAVSPDIKWPNDVMVSDRKICGILLETASDGDRLEYAVLGIGVNLSQRTFPDGLLEIATSLFLESGRVVEPEDFLPPLLERLQHWYAIAVNSPRECVSRWEKMSTYAYSCPVRVISAGAVIEGTTAGLSEGGSLMVRLPNGDIQEIASGEISIRKLDDAARSLT